MDARKYLEQVRHIDEEIQSRLEEQESLKASLVSSPQINEDSVTSSPKGHYDDKFVKIVEYSQDIDQKVDELFALKHEISSAIDEVDDQLYRLILRERYINIKNWEQIEDQLHYSHRQIIRLHGEALESFRKVYNMAQNGT
ncbi:DUF1492 domain-containing protein [Tetragenococcus halophilus]|uniref:DUF1492 domain-containing protein n=1 Tax=Tetragenococcus halophilus TaxID=51669 RepID=A0A3G5FKZ7_TETHA|nr:DUF1492 domain-containing protein [Tetragenococcus halophilus]AYW50808.1 DUF1492 domain-containing protein [Tetragenococcus halophilus]GBD64891.1 hypothetical protein TEHD23766T_2318 [Tetragenococcus halophilus subsp. flandriensis]GMA08919.1 hypothetical protein GCM10025886_20700 [Tetragenococcus halophilus subsp. flandriensis]